MPATRMMPSVFSEQWTTIPRYTFFLPMHRVDSRTEAQDPPEQLPGRPEVVKREETDVDERRPSGPSTPSGAEGIRGSTAPPRSARRTRSGPDTPATSRAMRRGCSRRSARRRSVARTSRAAGEQAVDDRRFERHEQAESDERGNDQRWHEPRPIANGSARRYGTADRNPLRVRSSGLDDDSKLERHEHDQDGHEKGCDRRKSGALDEGRKRGRMRRSGARQG